MKDVCIIAQGGGIKSAYTVGVIRGLREKFDLNEVKDIVAVSGSAATFMYFISKQYDEIEQIWLELMKNKKFIKFKNLFFNKPIIDIDYLVDVIVKEKFPFDINSFKESKTRMHIAATNVVDGKADYFSNKEDIDFFEIIRATCAVPYFYGRKIQIKNEHYIDGTISDMFGLKKALEIKPKNLLVILTEPSKKLRKAYLIRRILEFLLLRNETEIVRNAIWNVPKEYDKEREKLLELKKYTNLAIIQPKKRLPSVRLDANYSHLKKTIEIGYEDTINHHGLENFFKNVK